MSQQLAGLVQVRWFCVTSWQWGDYVSSMNRALSIALAYGEAMAVGLYRATFEFEIYPPYLCAWPRTSGMTAPFHTLPSLTRDLRK